MSNISSEERDLFTKERIPLFSEVLEIAKNNSKFIIFDLLHPPLNHKHYNDTLIHVIEAIRESGIDPALVSDRLVVLHFPTCRHILTHHQQTAFENILAKEEIAHNEQFLLLPQFLQVY